MKKNKTYWILTLMVTVSLAIYIGYTVVYPGIYQGRVDHSEPYSTSMVRIGDLTILTSGTGQIIPAAEFGMSFVQSGTIIEIPVQVGDDVRTGDVLAVLRSDKSEAQLAAEVAAAELAVAEAQAALDELYADAEMAAAEALVQLEDAQLAFVQVQDLELEKALALQTIAYAQESIANAEMLLYIYNASPSEDDVYTAYASWLFKQEILDKLTDQVNKTIYKMVGAPEEQQDRLESQLLQLNVQQANQRLVVEDAIYRMETIDNPADPIDVAVAESQLATARVELTGAQKEYNKLLAGPNPGDLALAEASLAEAQADWESLKDGPPRDEITLLETQLTKANLELEILRQETTIIELVAPIDCTVTGIDLNVGDRVDMDTTSGSDTEGETNTTQTELDTIEQMLFGNSIDEESSDSMLTIADLSMPLIEIYIDESDLTKVQLGYPVEITFDALSGETFRGEIIEIASRMESVSGIDALRTVVLLDGTSYAKPNPLPIGLSAQADIIAGQVSDAVLVPVEALVEIAPGKYIVYVIENDQPVMREVIVGLVDFTTAEILEGLQAGEIIALGYEN